MSGIIEIPCLLLYFDRFPIPSKIQFELFVEAADEETRKNLRQLSFTRNDMIEVLKTHDAQESILKINEYLKYLNGFMISSKKTTVQTFGPIKFTWNSVLGKDATKEYVAYTYKFDLIMCLATLAFAHVNVAHEQFQKYPETSAKLIAENLKNAALIVQHMCKIDIPSWKTIPKEKPLEADVHIMQPMINYLLASAQIIPTKKTAFLESVPNESSGKLAMFICKSFDDLVSILENSESWQKNGSGAYFNFFAMQYYCYMISTRYFQSKCDKEQGNHGVACDRMNYCMTHVMPEIGKCQNMGHLSFYNEEVGKFSIQCNAYRDFVEKENATIYYLPTSGKIHDLPKNRTQYVNLEKEKDFELPEPAFVDIRTK